MSIVVTGSNGRMGRTLAAAWRASKDLILLDKEEGCNLSNLENVDAVVHLAVDFANPAASLDMLDLVLDTSSPRHLVHASSLTVDPHAGVDDDPAYIGVKRMAELRLAAWASQHPLCRTVALRFGHFNPGSRPPHNHEAVRLTEIGLLYWVERALSDEPPVGEMTIWTASGRGGFSDGLTWSSS